MQSSVLIEFNPDDVSCLFMVLMLSCSPRQPRMDGCFSRGYPGASASPSTHLGKEAITKKKKKKRKKKYKSVELCPSCAGSSHGLAGVPVRISSTLSACSRKWRKAAAWRKDFAFGIVNVRFCLKAERERHERERESRVSKCLTCDSQGRKNMT